MHTGHMRCIRSKIRRSSTLSHVQISVSSDTSLALWSKLIFKLLLTRRAIKSVLSVRRGNLVLNTHHLNLLALETGLGVEVGVALRAV